MVFGGFYIMDRYFGKNSFDQFSLDICNDKVLYDSYELPKRSSKNSCGYIRDEVIPVCEIVYIPTGYKAKYLSDAMFLLVIRSCMGFKYNVRMCNQVGIIDSDYYNNCDNEGHMWVALQNEGNVDYIIKNVTFIVNKSLLSF